MAFYAAELNNSSGNLIFLFIQHKKLVAIYTIIFTVHASYIVYLVYSNLKKRNHYRTHSKPLMILIFRDKQIGGQNQQVNHKLNYKETAPKNIIIAFGCWDEKVVLIYSVADSLSISFIDDASLEEKDGC